MKKIFSKAMMVLLVALTMTTFTSCDKDTLIAMDLDGVWAGTIVGDYYYDRYGLAGDIYDSEICFYQNGDFTRGGTGYQIDRNRETRRYTRYNFDWKVRDRRIDIIYNDNYKIIIRDYDLYQTGNVWHFRGYFDDANDETQLASFDLVKVTNMRSVTDDEGAVKVAKEEFK